MPPKAKGKLKPARRRLFRLLPRSTLGNLAAVAAQRQAGADLLVALLSLLALCKLTAIDFCILCPYAALAEVPGADFAFYAYPPGMPTQRYQEHLDRVIPGGGPYYPVDVPTQLGNGTRGVRSIPTSYVPAQLVAEFEGNPAIGAALHGTSETVPDVMQTEGYNHNPLVVAARERGGPLPLPLAVYLDGVAFTSQLAGRSDTVIGVWIINLVTWKRHLYSVQRSLDRRRCGRRRWCSFFPVFLALQWQLLSLQLGKASPLRHDLSVWDPGVEALARDIYGFACMLLWIKGDWDELRKALGLQGWTSWCNPCFVCEAIKEELHSVYRSAMLDSLPWPLRSGESYDASCRTCEIEISIATAGERAALVGGLGRDVEKRRVAKKTIARFPRLQLHDRLHPSVHLLDVGAVESMRLPRVLTFWRPTWHGDSCVDPMRFRCPLFCTQLSTSPQSSVAIDSLHTLYFGPMMRCEAAVFWRLVNVNPWRVRGPTTMGRIDTCCKRLTADLLFWRDQEKIHVAAESATLRPRW